MSVQEQVVYVVDDDQGMLDSTVWLLESVGLKALPFTSGRAFLEACDRQRNACVLLDVRMPGMGGLNVQEELRRRGIDLPLIFVSGHADVPIVVRAFRAGAVDFIEKPYNEQLLLDSVQQALASRVQPPPAEAGRLAEVRACLDQLTPRERDVLRLYAAGLPLKAVAERLGVAYSTAKENITRVRVKYVEVGRPAPTKVDLLRRAMEDGLVVHDRSDGDGGR
jgi:FixJ family two-component response regulator